MIIHFLGLRLAGRGYLSRKIISQQLADNEEKTIYPKGNLPCVLEVISLSNDINSVVDVQHFSFLQPKSWNNPVLTQFSAFPQINNKVRSAHISLPKQAKSQLIHQVRRQDESELGGLDLHDVLHVESNDHEYYFRVVPKVIGPSSRRSIWSDPFYIISVFCVIIGSSDYI